MRIDFTLSAYRELLEVTKESGYDFYTIKEWIEGKPESGVVIRHDVDRRAANSLRTAELEHASGIRATYYFRMTKGSFRRDIIERISGMGHEAGYHYEDLSMHGGNYDNAIRSFESNLARLRQAVEVSTAAMHGKPTSKINNLDLWKKYDFRNYGLAGEAYLSPDFSDIYYFSDTGRNWKSKSKSNYKDYAAGLKSDGVKSTADLINFIKRERPSKLMLMTHPERWNAGFTGYAYYLIRDGIINTVKSLYSLIR